MSPMNVIARFARMMAPRGLAYLDACRVVARESVSIGGLDATTLQQAGAELGHDWASAAYEAERRATVPAADRADTETGAVMTVHQLLMNLTAMCDADPDVGGLRVVLGDEHLDIGQISVEVDREDPVCDDGVVLALR